MLSLAPHTRPHRSHPAPASLGKQRTEHAGNVRTDWGAEAWARVGTVHGSVIEFADLGARNDQAEEYNKNSRSWEKQRWDLWEKATCSKAATQAAGEGMMNRAGSREDAPQKTVKLMKALLCTQPVHKERGGCPSPPTLRLNFQQITRPRRTLSSCKGE